MINAARSVGAAAKFTGSGGAIVAFCPMGEEQEVLLQGMRVSVCVNLCACVCVDGCKVLVRVLMDAKC
jgi:mevalonate kinase